MKSPGLYGLSSVLFKTFQEEIILIFHKLFEEVEEENTLPNLFYEANIANTCKRKNKLYINIKTYRKSM